MDYRLKLRSEVLSEKNINQLVESILSNYRISQKAITKCINIVINNMTKYLTHLSNYPQNDQEFVYAVNFLNTRCYDDFIKYLETRYPDIDLKRHPVITDLKQPTKDAHATGASNMEINKSHKVINHEPEITNVIVISESEKNELLKKYQMNIPPKSLPSQDDLLYLLSNPYIMQLFSTTVNHIQTPKNIPIVFDSILSKDDANVLLANNISILQSSLPDISSSPKISESDKDVPKETIPDPPKIEKHLDTPPKEDVIKLDITKGLTKEMLPLIEARVKELIALQNDTNDLTIKEQFDDEKKKILKAVYEYKQNLHNAIKEDTKKINNLGYVINDNDNMASLDLKFDPTNDHNDMKNIVIKSKSDKKIADITLKNYYFPFNENNVTRFNNKFTVYFNNKLFKINIPPAKYDVNTLLNYIKSQATFLDFMISDNIITIKNTMSMKFDLMIDDDSVYSMLGFTNKPSTYRENFSYTASGKYNMTCNEKIYFSLSGTSMEPMLMEFDKLVEPNISLRKAKNGINIKQITLSFTNEVGQCYDFIMPFNMFLQITYLEK